MPSLDKIKKIRILDEEDITQNELSEILNNGSVSIDIETTGLSWENDQLATVQLYSKGLAIIYKESGITPTNLIQVFSDPGIEKVFHHAMFDIRFMTKLWDVKFQNVVCTKVASKILNKNEDDHSLKTLLLRHMNVDIEKDMWGSNWLNNTLTKDQIRYALNDVIYLQPLFDRVFNELKSSHLEEVTRASFDFIPFYAWLQVNGYEGVFEH